MCQTIQWLFNCAHPATYRFRNAVCQFPGSTECQLEDYSETLPVDCRRCSKRGHGPSQDQSANQPPQSDPTSLFFIPDETWFIPSRCFIDVGFSTLDPFAPDREIQILKSDDQMSNSSSTSTSGSRSSSSSYSNSGSNSDPGSRSSSVSDTELIEVSMMCGQHECHDDLSDSLFHKARKTSPCCVREQKFGAYQTTRLEGFEYRYEGKIVDSHCESAI